MSKPKSESGFLNKLQNLFRGDNDNRSSRADNDNRSSRADHDNRSSRADNDNRSSRTDHDNRPTASYIIQPIRMNQPIYQTQNIIYQRFPTSKGPSDAGPSNRMAGF
jgi:hypothetical protein